MANVIISPSLLSCDFLNIETELNQFKDFQDLWFHLDIMDGHFVPNTTFGHPIIKMISRKTDIPLDAHFMVTNPRFYIDTLKEVPLHNFTFHIEATDEPVELLKEGKKYFKSKGISIKPNTEVSALNDEILKHCDLILVMSVEPGFGGQKFMPNSIDKIKLLSKLREENGYTYTIQVDGGVSDENAKILLDAGADNLVAGSYVFKKGPREYKNRVDSLRG